MRSFRRPLTLLVTAIIAACAKSGGADAQGGPASPQPASREDVVRAETFASGLVHPWALEFLPDGRLLVTERPGRLRIIGTDGKLSAPLAGVPTVYAEGQGGLLDVALDPQFATTRRVYLSFAENEGELAGTAVASATLGETGLTNVQVIYRQRPKLRGAGHFGSRLVFAPDGKLFITQGDRQAYRDRAQDLTQGNGKFMRINADGTVPPDNPFVGRSDAQPEIWSYGHRNSQGATLDADGRLWTIEHGARGGDELNHPEAGKNYGWPLITYGRDYSGARIGSGTARDGLEQPVYYWDPVIAPGGIAFYTGDAIAGWKGSLLIASLTPGGLVRLELAQGRVVKEERYLGDLRERFRDVKVGPDGLVYVVTDSPNGRVLRIGPIRR
jgi:aldose sugar dehydrogenase